MNGDIAGVYYILNTRNDRIYIGQSWHINKRFVRHRGELRSNCHHSKALQKDWNAFEEQAFEFGVLATISWWIWKNNVKLCELERSFIHTYQSDIPAFGYNTDPKEKGRQTQARIRQTRYL